MTEPTVTLAGHLCYRWISRGGVQITGRLYTQHALRCVEAWRTRQAERQHLQDVFLVEPKETALQLRRRA